MMKPTVSFLAIGVLLSDGVLAIIYDSSSNSHSMFSKGRELSINPKIHMMLLANGFGITPKQPLVDAFKKMVSGRRDLSGKATGNKKRGSVLTFWDSCFAKASVWSPGVVPDDREGGHCEFAVEETMVSKNAFGADTGFIDEYNFDAAKLAADLEDCPCEDLGLEMQKDPDYAREFSFKTVSIIDKLATNEAKALIFELHMESRKKPVDADKMLKLEGKLAILREGKLVRKPGPEGKEAVKLILDAIRDASIIGFNGGNPDFHAFAVQVLCPECGKRIRARIKHGDAIGIGRSAGAMILVSELFSNEPSLWSWPALMGTKPMVGLQVAGKGISIRPHFRTDQEKIGVKCMALHDYAAKMKGSGGGVITIPNDSGVTISGGVITWIDGIGEAEKIKVMEDSYAVFDHKACDSSKNFADVDCPELKYSMHMPVRAHEVNDLREAWRNCERYRK